VEIDGKFPSPDYLNRAKWAKAPGFSNNKKYNRITVTINKKGERVQVFIDDNKMVDIEKAIPGSLLFNSLMFLDNGNGGENDKYYISNTKIVKS